MSKLDRCAQFSIEYLSIMQDIMHIEETANGYIAEKRHVTDNMLHRLNLELDDFVQSSYFENAKIDLGCYTERGRNPEAEDPDKFVKKVQTTAVGFAPDFDTLIKLGLVMGDRVVLWDTIMTNIRHSKVVNSSMLYDSAFTALRLRGLIKAGAACLLPPPAYWSERARSNFRDSIDKVNSIASPKFRSRIQGFINAKSLLEENGIQLQPYYFNSDVDENRKMHELLQSSTTLTTPSRSEVKSLETQASIQRMITHEELMEMKNVPPLEMYQALHQYDGLRHEFYDAFSSYITMKDKISYEQSELDAIAIKRTIHKYIKKRSNHMKKSAVGITSSVLSLTLAFGDPEIVQNLERFLVFGFSAASALFGFSQAIGITRKSPALLQVFSALSEYAEDEKGR